MFSNSPTIANNSISLIEWLILALFKCLLAKTVGWIVLSFCFSHSVFPSPVLFASVFIILSRSVAKCGRHGISVNIFYIFITSFPFPSLEVDSLGQFLFECSASGLTIYCIAPKNDFNFLSEFNCKTAFICFLFCFVTSSFGTVIAKLLLWEKKSGFSSPLCFRLLEVFLVIKEISEFLVIPLCYYYYIV